MTALRKLIIGRSVERRPIEAYVTSRRQYPCVVVFGGFHGDEPKSVYVARRLIEALNSAEAGGGAIDWVVVPEVNPDGGERRKRRNARLIDVNRNFPTRNWAVGRRNSRMFGGTTPASEPETRAVIGVVEGYRPAAIITIHSIGRDRFCNNYDGPGQGLAKLMARFNRYPVTASIGYPTPGSFGSWAGGEHGIPTITLELPSMYSAKCCWADNRDALLCGVSRFLSGT